MYYNRYYLLIIIRRRARIAAPMNIHTHPWTLVEKQH